MIFVTHNGDVATQSGCICLVITAGKIETVHFCDYLEDGDSKLI